MTNWDKIKYDFLDHINKNNITNFIDFHNSLKELDTKVKGDYFEYFCKLYFTIDSYSKQHYKNFYLYTEIPLEIKKKLILPDKDKGIDAIVSDNQNNIYAVQIKYRKKNNNNIPFGELATFQALTFGTDIKNIHKGIFFTSCIDVCNELKNDKYINIVNSSFDKCDNLFWINVKEYIGEKPLTKYINMTPLPHQEKLIPIIVNHYKNNNCGRVCIACGTGKTFLAFWTTIKEMKLNKIFIVVPSLYLLSQTFEVYQRELQNDNFHFILIGSDMDDKDFVCEYIPTTDITDIKSQIENNKEKLIVITTYHSSDLLIKATKSAKFKFDIGIYDEAHRTVGEKDKCFTSLLTSNIENKKLFMTATEKIYKYKTNDNETDEVLSMDNEAIYGKQICKYSIKEAIEDKVLVDYRIIAPFINNILNCNYKIVDDKGNKFNSNIVVSGILIIKSMQEYKFKHLLIFSNKNDKAEQIIKFIEWYLNTYEHNLGNVYTKYLSGKNTMNFRKSEVKNFENYSIGIISSARIFGEGVDIKKCDAVCFADGKGSTVDIIQYVGRALRKCSSIPDKSSYVIIPFILDLDEEFLTNENESFLKIRKILQALGTSDDMITEKFTVVNYSEKFNKFSKEYIYKSNKVNIIKKINMTIDIKELENNIIVKIFDKNGDNIDYIRNKLLYENKKRLDDIKLSDNLNLIDTYKKINEFLSKDEFKKIPINTKNYVKYAVGNKYFEELTKKYYYNKDKFIKACKSALITNIDSYKDKYLKDTKLPPYDYIDSGFYYDLDPKFNLQLLLLNNEESSEF
jgi:predicted helicase